MRGEVIYSDELPDCVRGEVYVTVMSYQTVCVCVWGEGGWGEVFAVMRYQTVRGEVYLQCCLCLCVWVRCVCVCVCVCVVCVCCVCVCVCTVPSECVCVCVCLQ